MIINLDKFGSTLVSRPAGKEAYLAFKPTLQNINKNEKIEIDFSGIEVLTPSWADEFITPIVDSFSKNVELKGTQNSSVIESLKILNLTVNNS